MTRAAVETLLWLLDEAFEASEHSLLTNLKAVDDVAWATVPERWLEFDPERADRPVGPRSIEDIVRHVGECKYMYQDHGFGRRALTWDGFARTLGGSPTRNQVMAWLGEGHRRLRGSVAELSDADLGAERTAPWGERLPTRDLVRIMIEHDIYHAGEVNHIRSLMSGDDRWAFLDD